MLVNDIFMQNPVNREKVKIWHMPEVGQQDDSLQLMHASYATQVFPKHSHDGFGVGVIERGALEFFYRGENVIASQGMINLVNPDEIHTGQAANEQGWSYRMFYFEASLLQNIASQIGGKPSPIPFFKQGVIQDDSLTRVIYQAHLTLETGQQALLEKQTAFLLAMQELLSRHADSVPSVFKTGNEKRSVTQVIDYIQANFQEDISVEQLANIANLSPFHFIRVFSQSTGLAPHAYLMQVRAQKAKIFIAQGLRLTEVAYQTGFSDQSHLSRNFKRIMGYTPGQYRNSIQDGEY